MNDEIICPHCHRPFPVSEAFKHQVKEEFEREQKPIMWKKAISMAEVKLKEQSTQELKFLKEEIEEKNKKLQEANEKELLLRKERLRLEEEKKEIELKTQRKLDEERNKISQDAYQKATKENQLKNLEHEKEKHDLLKQIDQLKQKAQQGSQQLQGEMPELLLEGILKKEFPYDQIKEVPKGIRGADIIQVVTSKNGRVCGTIIWESKMRKAWSDGWITKLKEDQRQVKAELAVIISQVLPDGVTHFGQRQDIWICSFETSLGLAVALRKSLIDMATLKLSMVGRQEKKEILWNYLTGIEFRQRVEAVFDAYNHLQDDMEVEKRWFAKKWAKQEKSIRSVIDNLLGMQGDLQSIMGKALGELKSVSQLPDGDKKDDDQNQFSS